jgi:hypothetical protein
MRCPIFNPGQHGGTCPEIVGENTENFTLVIKGGLTVDNLTHPTKLLVPFFEPRSCAPLNCTYRDCAHQSGCELYCTTNETMHDSISPCAIGMMLSLLLL